MYLLLTLLSTSNGFNFFSTVLLINFSFQISNFNDLASQVSQVCYIRTFGLGRENYNIIRGSAEHTLIRQFRNY